VEIIDQKNLDKAVLALQNGQTIVFPTETSYGLGCDATNQDAVDKIFKIKGRKSDKPLLVVVPDIEMAKKYLVWNDLLEDLASKYWPGPLTVVGEYSKKDNLAKGVVATDNTIAVRVTDFPLTKLLSEKLNRPLVATSANLSDAGNNRWGRISRKSSYHHC
jgi:L-threonylcarbamoyladenylate synthase